MNGTQIIELDLRTLSTECKKKCIGTLRKDCYLLFNPSFWHSWWCRQWNPDSLVLREEICRQTSILMIDWSRFDACLEKDQESWFCCPFHPHLKYSEGNKQAGGHLSGRHSSFDHLQDDSQIFYYEYRWILFDQSTLFSTSGWTL